MIKEFNNLSYVRRYTVYNVFLVSIVNAFLIAITLTLVIELFGADGAMFKTYAANLWPLILLVPFLGGLTSKNPKKAIRYSIVAEFSGLTCFSISQYGYKPEIFFILGFAINVTSNILMTPPRTQLNSIVINGEKDFSIFIEKVKSFSLATGSILGLMVIYFEIDILANIIGMFISLALSRYFVVKIFDEVFK